MCCSVAQIEFDKLKISKVFNCIWISEIYSVFLPTPPPPSLSLSLSLSLSVGLSQTQIISPLVAIPSEKSMVRGEVVGH